MLEYATLVASPRALPDGLILVFQHTAKERALFRNIADRIQRFKPFRNQGDSRKIAQGADVDQKRASVDGLEGAEGQHLFRRTNADDLSGPEQQEAVRIHGGEVQIVGNHHHGHAPLALELIQQVHQPRLVGQDPSGRTKLSY